MDFLNKAIRSLSNTVGEVHMNKKTILKFNSTASFLPAAWLALAILAVGAFGNSVQAQVVWLNDTLSGYTTDGVALTTTASPQLVATPGSTWTVLGAGSPKKLRTYKPAGAASPYTSTAASSTSRLTYKLSSDAANTTDRGPVGYLSYKVTPNPNAALTHLFNADAANTSWMEVGLGTTGTDALASGSQTFLSARFYYNLASVTPQFSVGFYMNNADLQVNPFGTSKTAITSGANTIKIWYNKSASGVSYTPPGSSSSVTLAANSWVAYVNDSIATGFQQTGLTFLNPLAYSTATITAGATTSSAVGKLGVYNGASGHTYDFSLSDIYVADSAPAVSVPFAISSAPTATVQASSNFSYTITTSGGTATSYNATGLPSYLSINTATGVISGTVPASTTPATIPIVLSATGATTVTANLSLAVTAAPSDYVWANTGTDWSSAASWTNNAVPASTSTAGFGSAGSSATSVNVGTGQSVAAMVFYPNAYAYTWTGTDITVGNVGGITNNSAATQTFGNKVINSGGDATWSTVSGGSLVFNGGIDLTPASSSAGRTLTFAGAGNMTVASVIANGGTATNGAIVSASTGTITFSGANTYGGTTKVAGGTLNLSGTSASSGYILAGNAGTVSLKVNATNALNSSATLLGASGSANVGTLDFTTAGNYTLNQYLGQNMNFGNSSGSASTLTFTNATSILGTTTSGKTFANQSANLTITFKGEVDISGSTVATNTITAIGPVVISNRVYNTNTAGTRSLTKDETGTLTMYGVNSYNGTTLVSKGTLSIPAGGSLAGCRDTIVRGTGTSSGNSASLNLAGAAGVVQVSTNGYVRGGGSITSLQVQDTGTVEVAVGSTWTTGGTISFTGTSTKVSVTGTPVSGQTYTLLTATGDITGTPTLVSSSNTVGWALRVTGPSIYLEEVGVITIASGSQIYSIANTVTGSIPLTKRGAGTLILDAANDYSGGTVVEAGTLQVQNVAGLGTGAVTLKGGTLKSTVDLDLAKLVSTTSTVGATTTGYTDTYGLIADYVKYTGNSTTLSGPVTLDVATGTTMTMLTLVGNSDANSLVTKIGAGTVKVMGGSTKLSDATALAANGNGSTVLGGWRIQEGTVWFAPSSNNGGGNGPITLAGGNAKFTKLQNSNGTFTGFEVPSDLTVENDGLIQYDPSPLTLLGQNNLGFKNLGIGAKTLEVATATTSTVQGQVLPSVNFKSATLTGGATLKNPENLDLNLQAVSGTGGFTKTGLGTLYLSDQPNQAAAFATLKSTSVPTTVESINVEYAGSGYTAAPEVTLVGGGATTQATATATIDAKGRVTSIAVNTAGSGYTSLPRVVIAAPATVLTANSYTGATIVQQGKLNLNGSYASSFTVKSGAALKLDWLAPAQARCSIDAISSGTSGYLTTPANAYVKDLYLTKSVGGYTPGATLNLAIAAPSKTDGTGLVPGGVAATATATVNSDGVISALNIVNGGSGYVVAPMVTIPAPTVPTVVARTTGSIAFESGANLSLNITPTSASYTLLTADGGITGTPVLETSIPGYALTKSSDGKSLLLEQLDTTKPVITLIGSSSVNVNYGASYTDLGATVDDNKDATRSINGTGSVNTSVPGSYTITFNATDAAGNVADTVTRTVVVGAAPDTTKPVIALIGSSTVNVDYGASYADLGATVTDNKDATRSINGVGSVNTLVPGSYTITFNATDAAGNVADTVTRTVVVGLAPVTDGYAVYLSSNGLPAGTAFNAKVNGVTAGLVYAFGSSNGSPRNNGVTAIPVMSGSQLTYTFDVKDDSALTVTYQTSTDLVNWTAAQSVSAGTGSSPAGFVKKQAQVTGSAKLFVRINVTHP
jgi:autotransporter-associated beta strand protein